MIPPAAFAAITPEALDIAEHVHGAGKLSEVVHTHAWATEPHTHMLRAICRRPECDGCETHNIHPAPEEWSRHGHQPPPGS